MSKLLICVVSDMSEENIDKVGRFMEDFAAALVRSQEDYIEKFKKDEYDKLPKDDVEALKALPEYKKIAEEVDHAIVDRVCFKSDLDAFPQKIKDDVSKMRDIKKRVNGQLSDADEAEVKGLYSSVIKNLQENGMYDEYFKNSMPKLLTVSKANQKAQQEINSPDVGYCLQAIMSTLNRALPELLPPETKDEKGELLALTPAEFLQKLKEDDKFKDAVYDNLQSGQRLQDIVDKNKIQRVSVILLVNKEGEARHAMFWDGSKNEHDIAVLRGFNGQSVKEEYDVDMSITKNGGEIRKGYIIDLHSVIAKNPEMVDDYYKRLQEDYFTRQAIKAARERIEQKSERREASDSGKNQNKQNNNQQKYVVWQSKKVHSFE